MRLDEDKGLGGVGRQHVAVMADEVVALVRVSRPMVVVDATVGTGGHAERLLEATDAHLLGIDRDADALGVAAARLARFQSRVTLRQADFKELGAVLEQCGIPCVGAIVADLGMSSFALDDPSRGFSFMREGPLD
ncbi:MAG TPA: 16S rRNA (cytosine(1402)-N(4))-methyltransferase, partial [Candidatus Binataceae bacterium]|nr:16S rRNA (cytosine(1402)-N(4))-methyltransferase [Candidatus Binataceae bacterium]